ncbi:hypothetical protein [Kitasatospora sp. NPDC059599]|uniref:hypothetical protein n=1 Tax=Kitasatospora sp. NPDC059599 TaxID=3346880 RepID=UPI00367E8DB9
MRLGADVLLRRGRVEQALGLTRPTGLEGDAGDAWRSFAEVLVGAGRVDEAIDALAARLSTDGRFGLVEVTEGHGRDERVMELLVMVAAEVRRAPEQRGVRHLWDVA